jgi:predicted TIM-barrel fold metal-dependent hydrolase
MHIIDAHTHIFPDKNAATILQATAKMFNVPTFGAATAADLLAKMDACGISHAVIHMVSPTAAGVIDTNTWLIQLQQDRFIKFGTLHPGFKKIEEEIQKLKDGGVKGVKFQPDVQQFTPDERQSTYHIYEALAKQGLTVMFHVGGEPLPSPRDRSKPSMILNISRDFPELKIIAAHLGGLNMWEEVYELLAGRDNMYLESSLSYEFIEPALAEKIIRKHGHDKIFFGTDYPFGDVKTSLAAARSVPFLTQKEKEDILGNNAWKFFLS